MQVCYGVQTGKITDCKHSNKMSYTKFILYESELTYSFKNNGVKKIRMSVSLQHWVFERYV